MTICQYNVILHVFDVFFKNTIKFVNFAVVEVKKKMVVTQETNLVFTDVIINWGFCCKH